MKKRLRRKEVLCKVELRGENHGYRSKKCHLGEQFRENKHKILDQIRKKRAGSVQQMKKDGNNSTLHPELKQDHSF